VNAFEAFADQHTAAPVKARRRAAAKRAEALDRRRRDDTLCLREWRRGRSEEVSKALSGPHNALVRALIKTCRAAPLWSNIDPAQLLAPFAGLDRDTYALARRIVSTFLANKRETVGLPPFDDPLPF
jgi:hypothetical protein